MSITSESDEMVMLKDCADSPTLDDANSGRNFEGSGGPLKKGPWTSVEDAILVEYVTKHGEGNWNAVQKHSGLARCGKSCRLRWANHLRPDLKKGAFTHEEERRIIELHAKMGNKWARMAAELPGRTDNEIKNYWNTRIKRRQRAGLPIYPPDLCLQPSNDHNQNDDMNPFSSHDMHHPDYFPVNNFEIPSFEIKNLELNQQLYPPEALDIPVNSFLSFPANPLLTQGLHHSYPNSCLLSRMHPKRFRGAESSFPALNSPIDQISDPFMLSGAYNHNPDSNHATSSSLLLSSNHADLNGNNPSSEPAWAMKLELPSLQTQTGSWGQLPSTPLPSLGSVDTLIQTPTTENVHSRTLSPRNSGLLDAVLYESKTMRNPSNNNHGQKNSHASGMVVDVVGSSTHDLHETEWEAYGESISPLGHSPVSGNSVDEPQSIDHSTGYKDASSLVPVHNHSSAKTPNHVIFCRPDLSLGSNYFVPHEHTKDHSLLKDTIESLHVDDLSRDWKQMETPASWSAMSTI